MAVTLMRSGGGGLIALDSKSLETLRTNSDISHLPLIEFSGDIAM